MECFDYFKKILILIAFIFILSKSNIDDKILISVKESKKINYTYNDNNNTKSEDNITINKTNLTNFNINDLIKNNSIYINPYYPKEA